MRVENEDPKILILAGQRSGRLDPLAATAGVTHKCVVPVLGRAMIGRVLETVDKAYPTAPIFISIEDETAVRQEPTAARLLGEGRLGFVRSEYNLVDSVIAAGRSVGYPMLITTGDNVLTTVEALHAVAEAGRDAGAVVVMAPKEAIRAAHSGGKNRYYEFRDGGFSNCNLFWIQSPEGLKAAEAFRLGGQFLKVKGRIRKVFGLLNLVLFKMKAFTLEQAFAAVSRRMGVRVRPLVLADGRLAIDVDDEKSLRMTEEILEREQAGGR